MRISFFTIGFLLFASSALAVEETDGFLFTHQGRHQAYEWLIPESRILKTPEWKIDSAACPLAPDKAWQIAKRWLEKNDRSGSTLVHIQIVPFIREGESPVLEKRLGKRFYYRIEVIPAMFDTMLVYVLLDGTVVEPRNRKPLEPETIK
jgi:hypothetical protein